MQSHPYANLPQSAFWSTGVVQENPYSMQDIYKKKYVITKATKIVTAGSCFAQHISHHLRGNGFNVLDCEPAPPGLPENLHRKYGFSMYSARYGNIYTARQLLQLAQEAAGEWHPKNYIWEKNGKYYDALRPTVEPYGLGSPQDVIEHRQYHISRVKKLFEELDLFIFTLGLTEMWMHTKSGTVYPSAPGTIAGQYDDKVYSFKKSKFKDILRDFNKFQRTLKSIKNGKPFKILLTVSPVPLTASASGKHVLVSSTESKSILRSVAGQLASNQCHIDYFPAFEIVTNPRMHQASYSHNLRSVRNEAVENVMQHFFSEHLPMDTNTCETPIKGDRHKSIEDIQCEDAILEAFKK